MMFVKITKEKLNILTAIIIVIPLLILFSPILVFLSVKSYFEEKAYKKSYEKYILKINNTNFFCYNNKQSIQELIEQQILPLLEKDINIIYLDGRTPITDFNQSHISTALYGIKDKKGFPYLLKIRNGSVIDKSINAELFYTINHNETTNSLLDKIDVFFEN